MYEIYRHRDLIIQLTKRDILGRYKGSYMGLAWSVITPIMMLLVYTFVFSTVFRAKWGGAGTENMQNFSLMVYCGMIVHGFVSECLIRSPTTIVSNPNYINKIIFPVHVLPVVTVLSALFHFLINMLVLLAMALVLGVGIGWTALYSVLLVVPLLFLSLGLAWLLASMGVYLRDIGQLTGFLSTVLMFMSPVFYPMSALPVEYHWLLEFNPLTVVMEQLRAVMLLQSAPAWALLFWLNAFALLAMLAGYTWFEKTKRGFADVL